MADVSPTRAVALELKDERRAMRDGYVFLDEKCLLLAGAILRELARYAQLAAALAAAQATANAALGAAIGRHGLEGVLVYPAPDQAHAALDRAARSIMGVRLQDVTWTPGALPAARAVYPSPEAQACRHAFLAVVVAAAEAGAAAGNLERLSQEYRRSVRRARALQDVLLPELERTLYGVETRLEELEQEDAITMRRRSGT